MNEKLLQFATFLLLVFVLASTHAAKRQATLEPLMLQEKQNDFFWSYESMMCEKPVWEYSLIPGAEKQRVCSLDDWTRDNYTFLGRDFYSSEFNSYN